MRLSLNLFTNENWVSLLNNANSIFLDDEPRDMVLVAIRQEDNSIDMK